ncbi:Response regulator MprA [bacterium HR40]|nr:Response regulator MprA [bacterium HR40]
MAERKRVLLVVDDEGFRRELAAQLRLHGGLEVDEAGCAAEALGRLDGRSHHALVVDAGLGAHASSLCRESRRRGATIPILVLAEPGEGATLATEGASEQLAKPVQLALLLARLAAQLRQFELGDGTVLRVGPYQFQPARKLLCAPGGKKIRLTEKETAILRFLCRVGDRPVPREVLLDEVWGYHAGVTTHTLETHIYRLRQKIEPVPGEMRLIVTEPGGYRLVCRSGGAE